MYSTRRVGTQGITMMMRMMIVCSSIEVVETMEYVEVGLQGLQPAEAKRW